MTVLTGVLDGDTGQPVDRSVRRREDLPTTIELARRTNAAVEPAGINPHLTATPVFSTEDRRPSALAPVIDSNAGPVSLQSWRYT